MLLHTCLEDFEKESACTSFWDGLSWGFLYCVAVYILFACKIHPNLRLKIFSSLSLNIQNVQNCFMILTFKYGYKNQTKYELKMTMHKLELDF